MQTARWSGEGYWSSQPQYFQPEMARLSSYHRPPLYVPTQAQQPDTPSKPTIITFVAPPSPPASPPTSPSSPSTPTLQSANLLRRLSRRLSHTRADLARRVSTGASPDGRNKRLSASPAPMGGIRGEGRPRLDDSSSEGEAYHSIASHLASPPPSAPASPSPQPVAGPSNMLRSLSMSTPSHSPSPSRAPQRLERSRSESVRGSLASGLTSGQLTPPENAWDRDWDTICRGRQNGRARGEGGLWWDAEMGICWDGNELLQPDLHSAPRAYNSNSNFVHPAQAFRPAVPAAPLHRHSTQLVFASRLSSFPPRPPLKGKDVHLPSPPASPVAATAQLPGLGMTPAELIREEWRKSQLVAPQANGLVVAAEEEEAEEGEESDSGDEFVDFEMAVEGAVEEMEAEAEVNAVSAGGEEMERLASE